MFSPFIATLKRKYTETLAAEAAGQPLPATRQVTLEKLNSYITAGTITQEEYQTIIATESPV